LSDAKQQHRTITDPDVFHAKSIVFIAIVTCKNTLISQAEKDASVANGDRNKIPKDN